MTLRDLARIEKGIRQLPAGDTICERLRAAIESPEGMESATANAWRSIGEDLMQCGAFPGGAFQSLLAFRDFDVRWPLTFACWYWCASGASVDGPCANFLGDFSLVDQAKACLGEFDGDPVIAQWRETFEHSCRTIRSS